MFRPNSPKSGAGKPFSWLALPAVLGLLLAGCQPRPAPAPVEPADLVSPWPPYDYTAAAQRGETVYRLEPAQTRIEIVVRSAGPLARFGHDHAVVVAQPRGYLLLSDSGSPSRADLRFDTGDLRVDPPEARRRHDLQTEMSADDLEGTRRNLLEKVLDPGQSPVVTLALRDFDRRGEQVSAVVAISLQDRRHAARYPFRMRFDGAKVRVEGSLVLRHSDLGLEPYTALGGGLKVADPMEVHFSLSGARYREQRPSPP